MRIQFFVPGLPAPAGSKRAFAHATTGRIIVTDDSGKRGRDWRAAVRDHAVITMRGGPPLTGPLRLVATFTLPRPRGHYGTGRNADRLRAGAPFFPAVKPDTTKLLRAVEDSLTGIVWRDDAQVVDQEAAKRYGHPIGVEVRVDTLED